MKSFKLFLFTVIYLALFAAQVLAEAELDSAIASAEQQELWNDPTWHALLHYKKNTFNSGFTSQVDAENFFLAKDGKTNPEAELNATIAAFFADEITGTEHPQCIFPARYLWLTDVLQLPSDKLPAPTCSRFNEWYAAINPQKLTLVFPTAFINNPSSMFGHTLLRIDAAGQSEDTNLLAYASNYAAETQGDNALIYAFKGIFGGYLGKFSVTPYYERLKQYQDMEDRDVWEYELNFSPQEVKFIINHLWEMRNTHLDYYYFDENCAYFLLALLEVPRSSLRLSDTFHGWVIPVDTVRVVTDTPGLVSKVTYRPSPGTILRHIASTAPDEQLELIKALAKQEITIENLSFTNLSPTERGEVLDSTAAYLNYQIVAGKMTNDEAAPMLYQFLKVRSSLPAGTDITKVPEPKVRPEQGHKTARVKVSGGWEEEKLFYQLEWRPAYHDLLDLEDGYKRGAQINFFDLAFRQEEENKFRLQRFAPLEILSLAPRDALISPKSWELGLRFERKMLDDGERHGLAEADGGMGLTYDWTQRLMVFGLARAGAQYSPNIDENYALGYGGRVGAALDLSDKTRALLESRLMRYGIGADHLSVEHALSLRYALGAQTAITAAAKQSQDYKKDWTAFDAGVEVYF